MPLTINHSRKKAKDNSLSIQKTMINLKKLKRTYSPFSHIIVQLSTGIRNYRLLINENRNKLRSRNRNRLPKNVNKYLKIVWNALILLIKRADKINKT
jgi:hypothetical protein